MDRRYRRRTPRRRTPPMRNSRPSRSPNSRPRMSRSRTPNRRTPPGRPGRRTPTRSPRPCTPQNRRLPPPQRRDRPATPRSRTPNSRPRNRPRSRSPYGSTMKRNIPQSRIGMNRSNNFNHKRRQRNYQNQRIKKSGMFDSGIWEQWNFERKLDQAPKITNRPCKRYYAAPGHLNQNPRYWSRDLKQEVFDEIMRKIVGMNMASGSNLGPLRGVSGGGFQPISREQQRGLDTMFERLKRQGAMMNHNRNNIESFDYYGRGATCKCGLGCNNGTCRSVNNHSKNHFNQRNRSNPRFANFNSMNNNLTPPPLTPMYGGFGGYNNALSVRAGNSRSIEDIEKNDNSPIKRRVERTPSPGQKVSTSFYMPGRMSSNHSGGRYKNSHIEREKPYTLNKNSQSHTGMEMRRSVVRSGERRTPERPRNFRREERFQDSIYGGDRGYQVRRSEVRRSNERSFYDRGRY